MISLFLGYCSKDSEVVREFSPILKALGLNVWEYQSCLSLGESFTVQIEHKISKEANGAIFILSRDTLDSKYTLELELKVAIRRMRAQEDFPVFFLIYKDGYNLLEDIPVQITDVHANKLDDLDFNTLLDIGCKILSKCLDTALNGRNEKIRIRAFDRGTMPVTEDIHLNCNWCEFLGNTEEVPLEKWGYLQVIIQMIKDILTQQTTSRIIYLEAKLRYTACFLLGYSFRQTTGFSIQINHYNRKWETPSTIKPKELYLQQTEPIITGPSMNLILDVSLVHRNFDAINRYLKTYPKKDLKKKDTKLTLVPIDGSNRVFYKNKGVAQDIAVQIFNQSLESFAKYSCTSVHLFFSGALPVAIFLGWLWNKGPKIILYEYDGANQTYFEHPYHVKL